MSFTQRLLLFLLLAGGAAALIFARIHGDPARLVILISIDTLRPERLGVYGGRAGTSPRIDALAKESVVFDQMLATAPWTLPSHMTMLTGLDPVAHGVRRSDYRLSGRVTTLAEAFEKAGYCTGGFTAGGFVSARYGFGQGFDVYRETMGKNGDPAGFAEIMPAALDWLDDHSHEDTFLFLHTFDVHAPYDTCNPDTLEQFRARPVRDGTDDYQLYRLSFLYQQDKLRVTSYARLGELQNDYDAGVHEADRGVGQLLDALAAAGRLESAVIIVTSDHGESFADHGLHIGHGLGLTDDELRVPLILRLPQREHAGRRIGTLADLGDVAPTLLDVEGLPGVPDMQGESLVGLVAGVPSRRGYVMGMSQNTESCFLVKDGFKFISSPSLTPLDVARRHLGPMTPPAPGADPGDEYPFDNNSSNPATLHYDFLGDPLGIRDALPEMPQLFNRTRDPEERDNLFLQEKQRSDQMAALLKQVVEQSGAFAKSMEDGQAPPLIDVHEQQMLDALGYIGAPDEDAARISLDSLPQSLREPLRNPYVPPDCKLLIEADQVAQFTRRRLEDNLPLSNGARQTLQDLGNKYVAWAVKNPDHVAYVRWRVEALTELAGKAGVTLDMDKWRRRFIELESKARQSAAAETPAPAAPQQRDPGADAGVPGSNGPDGDKPQR